MNEEAKNSEQEAKGTVKVYLRSLIREATQIISDTTDVIQIADCTGCDGTGLEWIDIRLRLLDLLHSIPRMHADLLNTINVACNPYPLDDSFIDDIPAVKKVPAKKEAEK